MNLRRTGLGLAGLAAVLGAAWLAFKTYQSHYHEGQVPPEVGIAGVVKVSENLCCGAVIHRLDRETTEAVRSETWLATARGSRWRRTPLAADLSSPESRWPRFPQGLQCATGFSRDDWRRIAEAASGDRAYYLGTPKGVFLLMEDEGWLVHTFMD